MDNIKIKQAGITDLEILIKVSAQAFEETFANNNTAEDMEKYIATHFDK